jgi:hypothetical protein
MPDSDIGKAFAVANGYVLLAFTGRGNTPKSAQIARWGAEIFAAQGIADSVEFEHSDE